ncbi:MAG: hypothetical protein ACODAD_16310 [Planctomycetota bacterium]
MGDNLDCCVPCPSDFKVVVPGRLDLTLAPLLVGEEDGRALLPSLGTSPGSKLGRLSAGDCPDPSDVLSPGVKVGASDAGGDVEGAESGA